jgi:hypothetical protein
MNQEKKIIINACGEDCQFFSNCMVGDKYVGHWCSKDNFFITIDQSTDTENLFPEDCPLEDN